MEKTIKEWLMELPDGYRERALENANKYLAVNTCDVTEVSLLRTINCAFVWKETHEGHRFWKRVKDHYAKGTPLPPLP